jgi:hypothetical protein
MKKFLKKRNKERKKEEEITSLVNIPKFVILLHEAVLVIKHDDFQRFNKLFCPFSSLESLMKHEERLQPDGL